MERHQSLFLLKEEDYAVYEETIQTYELLWPLLYEPERMGTIVKKQFINLFFVLYKRQEDLIINTNLSFFQAFQTLFVERIMRSNFLKQYNWKLHGDAARCYIVALYIGNYLSDCITSYLREDPERIEEVQLLINHVNTEKEGLLNDRFQSIQSHPRDLFVADANLVKYFTAKFQSEPHIFEENLKKASAFADELIETVFVS